MLARAVREVEAAAQRGRVTPAVRVKFLIDNTLGRVWREMHPDTRLVRRATDLARPQVAFDYLVPRTGEDDSPSVRISNLTATTREIIVMVITIILFSAL